ncbi:hypothetical protein Tco_0528551 [Tanacetum coccineum]
MKDFRNSTASLLVEEVYSPPMLSEEFDGTTAMSHEDFQPFRIFTKTISHLKKPGALSKISRSKTLELLAAKKAVKCYAKYKQSYNAKLKYALDNQPKITTEEDAINDDGKYRYNRKGFLEDDESSDDSILIWVFHSCSNLAFVMARCCPIVVVTFPGGKSSSVIISQPVAVISSIRVVSGGASYTDIINPFSRLVPMCPMKCLRLIQVIISCLTSDHADQLSILVVEVFVCGFKCQLIPSNSSILLLSRIVVMHVGAIIIIMNKQNASDRNLAQIIVCKPNMHKASNNQQAAATTTKKAANRPAGKQLPFAMLLPVLKPQLEKGRAMQLQTLYARLMVPVARQNTQRASSSLQSSNASALTADQRPRLLECQSDSHGG